MDGATRGDSRRMVAEREVTQRTKKESWRHRCQTVFKPLGEMPREHLVDVRVEPWKCGFPGDVLYTKAKKTDPEAHQREIAERALEKAGRSYWVVIYTDGSVSREQTKRCAGVVVEETSCARGRPRRVPDIALMRLRQWLRSFLWVLRQESGNVKLLYVLGHYVLGGNERADEEARRGLRMDQEGVLWSRKTRMSDMERRTE